MKKDEILKFVYTAQRTALNEYSLKTDADCLVSTISFTQKFAVWTAEGAPLTGVIRGLNKEAFPVITIRGVPRIARKRLLTNKFFFNNFDVWFEKEGEMEIHARTQAARWTSQISYQGEAYHLKRRSLFSFRFDLQRDDGHQVASFKETTPFWSVSARREFLLAFLEPIDDTLLTFAFFLAATDVYG